MSRRISSSVFISSRDAITPYGRITLYAVTLSMTFLIFYPFLMKHYALDTYVIEHNDIQNFVREQVSLGRFLSGLYLYVFSRAGINTVRLQIPFTFLAIIVLSACAYRLFMMFQPYLNARRRGDFAILWLACMASVCHVFILHWFLFPEVVLPMTLGLLMALMAVEAINSERALGVRLASAYFLVLASLSFYQAASVYFVIIVIVAVAAKKTGAGLRTTLREAAAALLVFCAASITDILLIKLTGYSNSRTGFSVLQPLENIGRIHLSITSKLQSTGLGDTPLYMALAIAAAASALYIGWLVLAARNRRPFENLILLQAIIGLSFGAIMSPHLMTSAVDVSPRSIAALLGLPCAIVIYQICRTGATGSRVFVGLAIISLSIYLALSGVFIHQVAKSRLIANKADRRMAETVCGELRRYEGESGMAVTRVAYAHDASPTMCHKGTICYGNFRALGRDWTVLPLLDLTCKREFSEAEISPAIADRNKGRNWDEFSTEQLTFERDTLYMMLY